MLVGHTANVVVLMLMILLTVVLLMLLMLILVIHPHVLISLVPTAIHHHIVPLEVTLIVDGVESMVGRGLRYRRTRWRWRVI